MKFNMLKKAAIVCLCLTSLLSVLYLAGSLFHANPCKEVPMALHLLPINDWRFDFGESIIGNNFRSTVVGWNLDLGFFEVDQSYNTQCRQE